MKVIFLGLLINIIVAADAHAIPWRRYDGVIVNHWCRCGEYYSAIGVRNAAPIGTPCKVINGHGRFICIGKISDID